MQKPRARAFGLPFAGTPGPLNAITDVAGVTVGLTTLTNPEGVFDRALPQKEMGSIIVVLITDAPLSGLSLRQVATLKPAGHVVPGIDTARFAALF